MKEPPIQIGISACLLGEKVRYDGGHKEHSYITGTLGRWFEFIPFCPEVAIGLGVPRPTLRLVGDTDAPRVVGFKDPTLDVTAPLKNYGLEVAAKADRLCGYLLKNKSPSCGMERVKVYREGQPPRNGSGVYARTLMDCLPWLPVEEEGRLGDPGLRDNFLERVFALHRWRTLVESRPSAGAVVEFHTRHKLTLLAHGAEQYRMLGRLVADAGSYALDELLAEYRLRFMQALSHHQATAKRQTNVLHHLMGYLKKRLSREDKQELLELIEEYRLGEVPLIAPLTLLQHHFRRHPHPYVAKQAYLWPSVAERRLRLGPG